MSSRVRISCDRHLGAAESAQVGGSSCGAACKPRSARGAGRASARPPPPRSATARRTRLRSRPRSTRQPKHASTAASPPPRRRVTVRGRATSGAARGPRPGAMLRGGGGGEWRTHEGHEQRRRPPPNGLHRAVHHARVLPRVRAEEPGAARADHRAPHVRDRRVAQREVGVACAAARGGHARGRAVQREHIGRPSANGVQRAMYERGRGRGRVVAGTEVTKAVVRAVAAKETVVKEAVATVVAAHAGSPSEASSSRRARCPRPTTTCRSGHSAA